MDVNLIIELISKVVAVSMGMVSIVLSYFPKEMNTNTHIALLSIGLTALVIAAL